MDQCFRNSPRPLVCLTLVSEAKYKCEMSQVFSWRNMNIWTSNLEFLTEHSWLRNFELFSWIRKKEGKNLMYRELVFAQTNWLTLLWNFHRYYSDQGCSDQMRNSKEMGRDVPMAFSFERSLASESVNSGFFFHHCLALSLFIETSLRVAVLSCYSLP